MILFFLGVVLGIVIGLTGAGGALLSMPVFMDLFHCNLKDASFYSLIAVILGALSNYFFQWRNSQHSLAVFILVPSLIGSYFSSSYKHQMSDFFISLLIAALALYSLFGIWFSKQKIHDHGTHQQLVFIKYFSIKTVLLGAGLGVLTTFTGLGGGIVLLPILISMYGLSQEKALATSLFIVMMSSTFSFLIQLQQLLAAHKATFKFTLNELFILGGSILVTAFLLKKVLELVSKPRVELTRKIVFTLIVVFAVIKIF